MTEQAPRPRRRLPRPLAVASASLATFLAVLTLLAAQMQAGRDPALGGGRTAVITTASGKQQVVTRTSGGAVVTQTGPGGKAGHHAITTRTSGGGGEGEGDD